MQEHLLERVRALEQANRRLKTAVIALGMSLLLLTAVAAFMLFFGYRMTAVWQAEVMAARDAEEAARRQAEQAVPPAAK